MVDSPNISPPKRGTPASRLTHDHVDKLIEIAEERIFWHGARRRLAAMRQMAITGATILVGFALWWPWLQEKITHLLNGIPL